MAHFCPQRATALFTDSLIAPPPPLLDEKK